MCSDKSSTNQRADHDVVSPRGPTIFIADPHLGDGKRFVVRADERLTPFLELEAATRAASYQKSNLLSLQRSAVGFSDWLGRIGMHYDGVTRCATNRYEIATYRQQQRIKK